MRFENEINKAIEIIAEWQRSNILTKTRDDKLNDLFTDIFSEGYRLGEME